MITILFNLFVESKIEGISFLSIDNAVKEFAESEDKDEIVDADTNKKPSEVLPDIFKSALNNDDITFELKTVGYIWPGCDL